MAMTKPSRPQYKPELDLTTPGQFFAQCVRVEQGLPNKSYPEGKPLVAIEFEVKDDRFPALIGKRCSIVCADSIYRDPQTRRESHFLVHARMMGSPNPERGVDPELFVGRWYYITCEAVDTGCYVRAAVPMPNPNPSAGVKQPPPPAVDLPEQGPDVVPF